MPEEKTMRYAVIGDPIRHSLSPVMHNAAFRALGLNAEYAAAHVTKDGLGAFVESARRELAGFNITVPHKNNIIEFLDGMSDNARACQSVNTVRIEDGRLWGDSTDGYGLEAAIFEAFDIRPDGRTLCFIGCGGAVQATAFHMASRNAARVLVINRTVSKADELCGRLRGLYPSTLTDVCAPDDLETTRRFLESADVIIQGTSLGLKPDDPPPVPLDLIPRGARIYDTIYKRTKLLEYAAANGMPHADGRAMLLHQGARSFSIWTGREAPVEVMRKALCEAADKREKEVAK